MGKIAKEYIVTLKNRRDLEEFYNDIESESTLKACIPSRSVECTLRRPISRNTNYKLTDEEARVLLQDPRVESVNVKIKGLSDQTNLYSSQTGVWSKSNSISLGQKNWGLYRCQLESNVPDWGSDVGTANITATVSLTATGKNVDIIAVDTILYPDHPEFGNRVVQYDWFLQHDLTVRGTGTTITNVARASNVATITTQTPHMIVENAVINIVCTSDTSFSASSVTVTSVVSSTTFRYANTGTNVGTTAATGFWRGVYQYNNYTLANNHATYVTGIIAGTTQGWAREANLYNLRSDAEGLKAGEYTPHEYLIDYIRQFHGSKLINTETNRKNPTLVNNSWGFGVNVLGLANRYSRINYRGSIIQPASPAEDTGISGVCSGSANLANLTVAAASGNRITTTVTPSATVAPIAFSQVGSANLVDLGAPTVSSAAGVDANDDAIWQLSLPFSISYLGTNYQNNVYVSSNCIISFGGGSATINQPTYSSPGNPKIMVSAGDRNCEALYGKVFGSSPNRTYTVRYEGYDGAYGSVYEITPNCIWEMTFYEATPEQIDIQVILNANYRGVFTTEELASYGLLTDGGPSPLRTADVDADISDAISEGIIFVGAAGNSRFKIDTVSGLDYNNFYLDNGLPIYYHRGSTPSASHPDVICVGEIGSFTTEYKSQSSNTGPRVDLYAPGTNVVSSVYDNTFTYNTSIGSTEFVISSGFAGVGSPLAQSGRASIVTATPHGLTTGDLITIDDCSQVSYNVSNAAVTVVDVNTLRFDISDLVYSATSEILTGTVKAYGVYQRDSGTSGSSAQVAGILALALEAYPWMTQSDAKAYILNYAKSGVIADSVASYTDNQSLQDGQNKFAFYHKERPDTGIAIPKSQQWLRPTSGLTFPRPVIRKN